MSARNSHYDVVIAGARVEVLEARTDKPVTKLRATVVRDDGTVALKGTAVCYTMPLTPGPAQDGVARAEAC